MDIFVNGILIPEDTAKKFTRWVSRQNHFNKAAVIYNVFLGFELFISTKRINELCERIEGLEKKG
mgnify:FL=1